MAVRAEAAAAAAVQHLHLQATVFPGNRVGPLHRGGGARPGKEQQDGEEEEPRPDQGEATARLFQNRTIGSGSGHPDRAR